MTKVPHSIMLLFLHLTSKTMTWIHHLWSAHSMKTICLASFYMLTDGLTVFMPITDCAIVRNPDHLCFRSVGVRLSAEKTIYPN